MSGIDNTNAGANTPEARADNVEATYNTSGADAALGKLQKDFQQNAGAPVNSAGLTGNAQEWDALLGKGADTSTTGDYGSFAALSISEQWGLNQMRTQPGGTAGQGVLNYDQLMPSGLDPKSADGQLATDMSNLLQSNWTQNGDVTGAGGDDSNLPPNQEIPLTQDQLNQNVVANEQERAVLNTPEAPPPSLLVTSIESIKEML